MLVNVLNKKNRMYITPNHIATPLVDKLGNGVSSKNNVSPYGMEPANMNGLKRDDVIKIQCARQHNNTMSEEARCRLIGGPNRAQQLDRRT